MSIALNKTLFLLIVSILTLSFSWPQTVLATTEVSSSHEDLFTGRNSQGNNGTRSLLRDSSGTTHIFYGGDGLYHASLTSTATSWTIETIDSNSLSGNYANSLIAADGSFRVVYIDFYTYEIKLASNATGSWTTQTLINTGTSFPYSPSIVMDDSGKLHLTYYLSSAVYYGSEEAGWAPEVVASSSGSYNSKQIILRDDSNNLHIIYLSTSSKLIMHAYKNAGAWTTETISTYGSSSSSASLDAVIDSTNQIHLCFYDSTNTALRYAHGTTGTWSASDTVEDYGRGSTCSLSVATDLTIRIVYTGGTSSSSVKLKLATNASGAWVSSTISSSNYYNQGISSTLDASNNVYAATSRNSYPLKFLTNSTGSWVSTTVDSASEFRGPMLSADNSGNVAMVATNSSVPFYATLSSGWTRYDFSSTDSFSIALAFDNSDNPVVAYDSTNGNIFNYATHASGSWVTSTIDGSSSGAQTGLKSSIAFDSQGYAHVAYLYSGYAKLMYATNATGHWESTLLDDYASSSEAVILQIDQNDAIHIVYYDTANALMSYATNSSGTWQTENITNSGATIYGSPYASFVLSNTGVPYVVLSNAETGDIRLATRVDGTWQVETILTATEDESYGDRQMSAAFLSADVLGISYGDSQGQLKLALNSGGSWTSTTIDDGDDTADVGSYSSLIWVSETLGYIVYTNDSGADLRLATINITTSTDDASAPTETTSPSDAADTTSGATGDSDSTDTTSGATVASDSTGSTTSGGTGASDETESEDDLAIPDDASSNPYDKTLPGTADDGSTNSANSENDSPSAGGCSLSPHQDARGSAGTLIMSALLLFPLLGLRILNNMTLMPMLIRIRTSKRET